MHSRQAARRAEPRDGLSDYDRGHRQCATTLPRHKKTPHGQPMRGFYNKCLRMILVRTRGRRPGTLREWVILAVRGDVKKPQTLATLGLWDKCLTMTYSHMAKRHATIVDASFHV